MSQKGTTIVQLLDKDGRPFITIKKISSDLVLLRGNGRSTIRSMTPALAKLFK
jgi:hypothetical protein